MHYNTSDFDPRKKICGQESGPTASNFSPHTTAVMVTGTCVNIRLFARFAC